MLLKKILITIVVLISTSILGSILIFLGNKNIKEENETVGIYEDVRNDEKEILTDNDNKSCEENITNNDSENVVEEKYSVKKEDINQSVIKNEWVNQNQAISQVETKKDYSDNVLDVKIGKKENKLQEENIANNDALLKENVKPEEDIYTFARNDKEIQNMIDITKKLIKENKDGKYSELVDYVDSINFIVEKSGNLFYPLFEYRIANIIMDNNFPEFYVYAEDVYKNGEYLRTEYYFQ